MSKFGVGVGDEFPVDDGNGQGAGGDQGQPRDDRRDYEEWKRRRETHRAQREEWHRRKDAFKQRVHAAARESFGEGDRDGSDYGRRGYRYRRHGFPFPLIALVPILILVLIVSLIAAIIKSPFIFLALALIGFFLFGHRFSHYGHRFSGHGHHGRGRDYDFDLEPSRAPEPKAGNDAIVTPPPSQTPPAAQ